MTNNNLNLLEIEPLRNLKFWHIWALGVGAVVGDGIFLLIGQGIQMAGPSAIMAFIIAGLLELFLQLSLSELAVGMPSAGAMSVWSERLLGKWWGYLAGMAWAMAWIFVGGCTSIALGRFLAWFIPVNELILAGIAVTIFFLLNLRGSLIAATTQLWLVIILVAIMSCLAIVGIPFAIKGIPENFVPFAPNGWKNMFLAIPLAGYAFMGTASLTTSGSEVQDIKDLPKALIWSAITFIVLYNLSLIVMIGATPWQELSMSESPYVTFANKIFGKSAASIVNLAAIIAATTTVLMGTFYGASRILFYEARNGRLPKIFGYLHPKWRTPTWGLFIIWIISISLIAIAKFNVDYIYVTISMQFLVASYITYALSILAAILYRKRFPEEIAGLPFKIPVPFLTFTIAILGLIISIYFAFVNTPQVLFGSLGWIIPLYLYYQYTNRKNSDLKLYQ
ncbi:MAG: hypothetical protein PWQ82_1848 [Thermosediminibacterales bacterium]|nr:hypothetical protein [Thermosediminibacterales bacterium]